MSNGRRGKRGGRGRGGKQGSAMAQAGRAGSAVQANGGFDSGRRVSERRGYVHWPTLDTQKELSPSDRLETMRKVRAAEANIGLVKRLISGPSNLIGYLTPQANTGDVEFDKVCDEAFERRANEPQAFDMAGKMNFKAWQKITSRNKLRDGDALSVLTEGAEKGGRILFYEAHQLGDGRGYYGNYSSLREVGDVPKNLRDGVYLDRWGGRAGFRLLDAEGKPMGPVVRREQAIFHEKLDRVGRPRAVSGLSHAVSNFLDMVEILADTKHAIKVAAQWGLALEKSVSTSQGSAEVSDELKNFLGSAYNEGSAQEVVGDDGVRVEEILKGGRMQEFAGKVQTLQDSRPHPNILAMMGWLVRDAAHGIDLYPEVMWDLSGLNGTSIRYAMESTKRFVMDHHEDLRRDCQRVRMYFLAKEIKAGRLVVPAGVERWWECKWIPQADPTIDIGRMGKLEQEQLANETLTREEYWARRGKDWRTEESQLAKERDYLASLRGE